MTRQRGTTLVEVILAMVVATALVGMLAAVVSRMMAANAASQEHLRTVVTLGRLGEQFRRDARASHNATIEDANDQPARLSLDDANRSIKYVITPLGLERVVSSGGEARQHERFELPGMKFIGWNLENDGRAVSLILGRLARPGRNDATLRGRFSIFASLAKHEPPIASP